MRKAGVAGNGIMIAVAAPYVGGTHVYTAQHSVSTCPHNLAVNPKEQRQTRQPTCIECSVLCIA